MGNPYAKDLQIQGIHNARRFLGDRLRASPGLIVCMIPQPAR